MAIIGTTMTAIMIATTITAIVSANKFSAARPLKTEPPLPVACAGRSSVTELSPAPRNSSERLISKTCAIYRVVFTVTLIRLRSRSAIAGPTTKATSDYTV